MEEREEARDALAVCSMLTVGSMPTVCSMLTVCSMPKPLLLKGRGEGVRRTPVSLRVPLWAALAARRSRRAKPRGAHLLGGDMDDERREGNTVVMDAAAGRGKRRCGGAGGDVAAPAKCATTSRSPSTMLTQLVDVRHTGTRLAPAMRASARASPITRTYCRHPLRNVGRSITRCSTRSASTHARMCTTRAESLGAAGGEGAARATAGC